MSILNWTQDQWKEFLTPIGYVLFSFLSFRVLQFAVRWYLFNKWSFRTFNYFEFVRRRRRPPPPSQSLQVVPPNKKWRICNESVSFFHSVISGLWALYACIIHPQLASDMLSYTDPFPQYLIYMSFGYLLHDLIDLLINERSARILELLFHHVVVITAFMTTLTTNMFLGVVVFGLLMELNSVFLHTRSLMNLYRQPKDSTAFKFIALLNLATFVIFRMAVSVYLIYWQATNTWFHLAWYLCLVSFLVIYSLATTNTILFYRVLAADGVLGKKRARLNTNAPSTKSDETEDDEVSTDPSEEDIEANPHVHNDATQTPLKNGKIIRRGSVSAATQTPNGTIQVSDTLPLTTEEGDATAQAETGTSSTTISVDA